VIPFPVLPEYRFNDFLFRLQSRHDCGIDGIPGNQVDVNPFPRLPRTIHALAGLVIVAQAVAERVVNAVSRPGEIDPFPAGFDLHAENVRLTRLPF
jgi:hypothetical protein